MGRSNGSTLAGTVFPVSGAVTNVAESAARNAAGKPEPLKKVESQADPAVPKGQLGGKTIRFSHRPQPELARLCPVPPIHWADVSSSVSVSLVVFALPSLIFL